MTKRSFGSFGLGKSLLVESSSLGTPDARRLRSLADMDVVRRVLDAESTSTGVVQRRRPPAQPPSESLGRPEVPTGVVAAAQRGDAGALTTLYRAHDPVLRWLLSAITGPKLDVEDLAAEIWLLVARSLGAYRGGERRFLRWLVEIATTHLIDRRIVHVGPADRQRLIEQVFACLDDSSVDDALKRELLTAIVVATDPKVSTTDKRHRRWRRASDIEDATDEADLSRVFTQWADDAIATAIKWSQRAAETAAEQAETEYRRAAEAGDTNAMNSLGTLLTERGDLVEAQIWYRRGTEVGDVEAMNNLGFLAVETRQGQDVPADPPSSDSSSPTLFDTAGVPQEPSLLERAGVTDAERRSTAGRPSPAIKPPAASNVDAPYCMQCGVQMQRAGSCHACPSCGSTSGCS